jgi:hypothetical protein
MFETLFMQTSVESFTGIIVAVTTLVSVLSGFIVHKVNQPKIKALAELAQANADKVLEAKSDISTLAKVTYDMLPEEASKIVDAQNVKLSELKRKLDSANLELTKLSTAVTVKTGT